MALAEQQPCAAKANLFIATFIALLFLMLGFGLPLYKYESGSFTSEVGIWTFKSCATSAGTQSCYITKTKANCYNGKIEAMKAFSILAWIAGLNFFLMNTVFFGCGNCARNGCLRATIIAFGVITWFCELLVWAIAAAVYTSADCGSSLMTVGFNYGPAFPLIIVSWIMFLFITIGYCCCCKSSE